jgi:anti-anti-sigma regulatory factor
MDDTARGNADQHDEGARPPATSTGRSRHRHFEVEQRRYPNTRTTVVRPVGELSVTSVSMLRAALRRAVREDSAVIVVDLGLASVRDEDVVAPLVEAARMGRALGAEVVVATAPDEIAPRLRSCGLTDRRRPRAAPVDRPATEVSRRRHA